MRQEKKKKKDPKDTERSRVVLADGGGIWGGVGPSRGRAGIKKADVPSDEMLFDF